MELKPVPSIPIIRSAGL